MAPLDVDDATKERIPRIWTRLFDRERDEDPDDALGGQQQGPGPGAHLPPPRVLPRVTKISEGEISHRRVLFADSLWHLYFEQYRGLDLVVQLQRGWYCWVSS